MVVCKYYLMEEGKGEEDINSFLTRLKNKLTNVEGDVHTKPVSYENEET